jgi:hypothetical protein
MRGNFMAINRWQVTMGLDVSRRSVLRVLAPFVLALCAVTMPLWAQEGKPKPTVWMSPPSYDNGKCFRELFEHPDEWQQTRASIDVLFCSDHRLKKDYSDDELRKWFGMLSQWKLKFAMEVGAIKPWGLTGEKTFNIQKQNWDHLQSLGANFYAIAMDEPLLCCRQHIHKPDDYAVEETASFIALVRQHFPQMLVGDIEPYPSLPLADHIAWIEALQQKLAEKGVRGLDFYRLDVNWSNFIVFDRGTWPEVKKLERYCRSKKLPFSMIYWASAQPSLKRLGLADDSTWYISIMHQGYAYAMAQGTPDQYVVESWIDAPTHSVPETDPWTFTRSVLDFSRTFVKRQP